MVSPDWSDRHASTQHILQFFESTHLREDLRPIVEDTAEYAQRIVALLPDGPELSAGMRKLVEAKDCFVRAAVLASKPT